MPIDRYRAIRRVTEELARPLTPEDCALQSAPFTSPVKWHLAHTTWFFETFLLADALAARRVPRPEYRVLFNSYYQAVGERHPRPERGLLSRPSLDEVMAWRRDVDEAITTWLDSEAARDPRLLARLELGLQHEQQHQELLLADVKHLFWKNPLRPAYRATPGAFGASPPSPSARPAAPLRWRAFPAGERSIGDDRALDPGEEGFAYDNEGPRHRALVPAFELADRLVTNGDFLAFLEADGYRRPELWLAEGFDLVQSERLEAPLYWQHAGGPRGDARSWSLFTLDGVRPLAPDEPVAHVSFHEADACARFAGARLPTEFEWEAAAAALPVEGTFLESGALHPLPARPAARGDLAQMFGDLWQWTRSAYAPYPGYRAPEGALGEYNGKFMVNQLVLRGGCCVSPRSHLRATYRNFFHAHERWPFAGIRLARDAG